MKEAPNKYLRSLPYGGVVAGFIVSAVWTAPSILHYVYSRSFHFQPIVVLEVFAVFAPPLCVLGWLWGWSERLRLERALGTGTDRFDQAIRRTGGRQIVIGMVCGAAFILFTFGTGFLLSFKPWNTEDNFLSSLTDISSGRFGGALVGLIVGVIFYRSLHRKFDQRSHLIGP
jgi:hypothetical protein